MKTLLTTAFASAIALSFSAPAFAFDRDSGTQVSAPSGISGFAMQDEIDRKGRNRGGKTRTPGGSGCDDPGDILEHPECAG